MPYANSAGPDHLLHSYSPTSKAVVGGPAGPASAGTPFWPIMLLAVPLFFFSLFCSAYSLSVKLFNRIIKSAAFNACFVNAMINNARGSFHLSKV